MIDSLIKTEANYNAALCELEGLIERSPEVGSPEANRMEVLSLLIGEYEERTAPIPLPSPIEAIRFRMDQMGLEQRDLIPYIGSRNRVSEVLAEKRPLTLTMIRALNTGLGIPASVLLQEPRLDQPAVEADQWSKYPLKEMLKRGWIEHPGRSWKSQAERLLREFYAPLGGQQQVIALFNRTRSVRSARTMDPYALQAWCARVASRAMRNPLPAEFSHAILGNDLLAELVKLSADPDGPLRAQEVLAQHGIHLVVERHLPKTQVDAAAFYTPDGQPVIGLTVRYDRLDNFWHCLIHELVHLWRHLKGHDGYFIDDLDSGDNSDPREIEADQIAAEALVPAKALRSSRAAQIRTPGSVQALAATLGVHPAVVAGRVRHEARNYRILNQLVGQGEVRRLFPGCGWPA